MIRSKAKRVLLVCLLCLPVSGLAQVPSHCEPVRTGQTVTVGPVPGSSGFHSGELVVVDRIATTPVYRDLPAPDPDPAVGCGMMAPSDMRFDVDAPDPLVMAPVECEVGSRDYTGECACACAPGNHDPDCCTCTPSGSGARGSTTCVP